MEHVSKTVNGSNGDGGRWRCQVRTVKPHSCRAVAREVAHRACHARPSFLHGGRKRFSVLGQAQNLTQGEAHMPKSSSTGRARAPEHNAGNRGQPVKRQQEPDPLIPRFFTTDAKSRGLQKAWAQRRIATPTPSSPLCNSSSVGGSRSHPPRVVPLCAAITDFPRKPTGRALLLHSFRLVPCFRGPWRVLGLSWDGN